MVDGGQADVLVDPAVTRDVVLVQQFIVVLQVVPAGADRYCVADEIIAVRLQHAAADDRHRVVGDIVEEGVAGAHCIDQA
ncbi:hypothetical protein D9M73_134460 [compost metagenome]